MNVDTLIANLPRKTDAERSTIQKRAISWADSGTADEKTAANKVLKALEEIKEREAARDPVEKVVRAFTVVPLTRSEAGAVGGEAQRAVQGRHSGRLR